MGIVFGRHCLVKGVALACLAGVVAPVRGAENRVRSVIDETQTVISGSLIHPLASAENDRGPVGTTLLVPGVTLHIKLSKTQQDDLDKLLEEQRDPTSANYQKWLTPEEYGARFGLSPEDMDKLTGWLRSKGLAVDHVSRSMNWVSFSGTAEQIDRTFHTGLHNFLVDGRMHFANTRKPAIPRAFSEVIEEFRGLHDFRWKPRKLKLRPVSPDFTLASGGHELAPGDIATIYDLAPLYASGINGTGQKIVVAGQTDVNLADVAAFRKQFGLSATLPQVVLFGKDPGTSAGDEGEADLDMEWTGAAAPNATIIYVNSTDVFTSVQYAISQNLAPVISLSYGGCEAQNPSSLRSIGKQANAQGITWLASSGDSGAAGCDSAKPAKLGLAVEIPASFPEVTAVGGTVFSEGSGAYWGTANSAAGGSALSYIPEMAWNDTATRGDLASTGGGASIYFTKPTWQTGAGVPVDGARDVPDVSLSASPDHDGYYFYTRGSQQVVGGTSVSAPVFAGIVSLLNQYLVSKGVQVKAGLGNINPTLYHLAGTAGVFHDVTTGNNIVPCGAGTPNCVSGSLGFSAGPGYDEVTGLGSVVANNLVTKWTSVPASIGTTMTLSANPASVSGAATTTLTATVKPVTGTTAPTGTVTFTVGTKPLAAIAAVTSGVNSVATLTLTGSSLSSGNNSITATYGGSATFNGSSATTSVTVTVVAVGTTTTISANPTTISSTQSTTLTATVKPSTGGVAPTGKAVFTLGGSTLGSVALLTGGSSATASLTVAASKLAIGNNMIAVTYSGTTGFSGSSATTTVSVTPAPVVVATTTTVLAAPASIAATASTVLTATVTPANGAVAPAGTVTFTLGASTLGAGTIKTVGVTLVATLTVTGNQLATGANTIRASYSGVSSGTPPFGASSGTVSVTVTGNTTNSSVSVTITPAPVTKVGKAWPFTIAVSNAGGPTTFTILTFNGTSYASEIPIWFGSTSLPANGKLTTNLQVSNVPVPTSGVFGFGGTDTNGNTWTKTVTVQFQ